MGDGTSFVEKPSGSRRNKPNKMKLKAPVNGGGVDDLLTFRNRSCLPQNASGSGAQVAAERNMRAKPVVDKGGRVNAAGCQNLKKKPAATASGQCPNINQSQIAKPDANTSQKVEKKSREFYVPHSMPMPRTISQPPARKLSVVEKLRTASQPPPRSTLEVKQRKREIEDAKLVVRERMWINVVNVESKRRRILLRRTENRMRIHED